MSYLKRYTSRDCQKLMNEILVTKHGGEGIKGADSRFISILCNQVDEINTGSEYIKPMVWIGMYIALASLFCTLAMAADLLHGFRNNKLWFPCKYFSLNAASITVITIAMKLPVDLSTPMPNEVDQATKLGSIVFMITMMANLMPSLASMDNKSLLANAIGLVILVITLIVNVCIEINTGVINDEHTTNTRMNNMKMLVYIYVVLIILSLLIFVSSALTIPTFKQIYEFKYHAISKTSLNDQHSQHTPIERLRQHVRRYWVMVHTSSPQFVIASTLLSSALSVICIMATVVYIFASSRTFSHDFFFYYSDYKVSVDVIYITQFIGVMVGSIAPIFRCFTVLRFNFFTKLNMNHFMDFKVESYWIQKLCEWKESQIPFLSSRRRSRSYLVHKLKNLLLSICVRFQMIIVVSCKIIRLITLVFLMFAVCCSYCWQSLKAKLCFISIETKSDDTNYEDLTNYVLLLEDETRLAENTLKGISYSLDHVIEKAKKKEHNNLLKLLEKSTGFDGVANFDMESVEPLLPVEPPNNWSLPIVTLTCIAIALPNTQQGIVNQLFKSVGEGLLIAHLVEESRNSGSEYVYIQKAAMTLWREVEENCKWLENTLERTSYNGKTSVEILKWFSDKSKDIVIEIISSGGETEENFSNKKLIAANSMYRISQTLLFNYEGSIEPITVEQLLSLLYGMIADIMVACFTNIPEVIKMKCHENVIEKREAGVEAAAKLLGSATGIINRLEATELPDIDPDRMAFIDDWRLHLKQSIP